MISTLELLHDSGDLAVLNKGYQNTLGQNEI